MLGAYSVRSASTMPARKRRFETGRSVAAVTSSAKAGHEGRRTSATMAPMPAITSAAPAIRSHASGRSSCAIVGECS